MEIDYLKGFMVNEIKELNNEIKVVIKFSTPKSRTYQTHTRSCGWTTSPLCETRSGDVVRLRA